jgi:hypothetical protein
VNLELSPAIGTRPSNRIANWFIAPLQFLIGIVHFLLIFLKAKYISLKTASSFGNNERFFVTFTCEGVLYLNLLSFSRSKNQAEHW